LANPAFPPSSKPVPTKADIPYGSPHQPIDLCLPPHGTSPFPVVTWFNNLWDPGKHAPIDQFLSKGCGAVAVEMRTMWDVINEKVSSPFSVCLLDARRAVQFVPLLAAAPEQDSRGRRLVGGCRRSTSAVRGRKPIPLRPTP